MLLRIHRSLSPDQGHRTSLYHLSTRQTLRRRQKSGGDSMSRPGFRRPQREGSEYALLSPGGAGTCANSARVILPVLRTMPFLSHCRGCVVAVERHVVVHPPELDTVTSYDSGASASTRRCPGQRQQWHCSTSIPRLPNYPRESAPLSAWYCGTRDRTVRLPTNRRFRAGRTKPFPEIGLA